MSLVGMKDRVLIATIGDEDTITGVLLAGTGNIDGKGKKNFTVVTSKTPVSTIEAAFAEYTERPDMAVVLINQHVRPIPISYLSTRARTHLQLICPPCHPSTYQRLLLFHRYRSQIRFAQQWKSISKPSQQYSRFPARITHTKLFGE
ncbi:V-type H+-transporting ATPase subunit F, partial [Phenoliferia sp. Uapishka_3]